jgi:hypothetical protein
MRYLQLKLVNLFCKYNVLLAEHTVASHTNSAITNEFCVFTKIHTKILYTYHLHTKWPTFKSLTNESKHNQFSNL